ncbi:hypothetical protein K402DRAFT_391177, partial [Aulographum hederae CBS 113979]
MAFKPRSTRRSMSRASYYAIGFAVFIIFVLNIVLSAIYSRENVPVSHDFENFEGREDCGVTLSNLYTAPDLPEKVDKNNQPYCAYRNELLEALSGGGRGGFDESYRPKGCHYRWYSSSEICMILERVDGLIFIGDDMLRDIYAAFNMLLRQNLASGALAQWKMDEHQREICRCENQFANYRCSPFVVSTSLEVEERNLEGHHESPYLCHRVPHIFLSTTSSPAPEGHHEILHDLLSSKPRTYKPFPVIHSLGISTGLSYDTATSSMDEFLNTADSFDRASPFLWVGPAAAGHLAPGKPVWKYSMETANEARKRGMEVLNMWNMTVQASSWDGERYGMKVALVQAMMIVNWLAKLESS